jgi:hypothetical protein
MKNNIITIILIILVGMVAFWYLNKTDNSSGSLVSDTATTDSTDAKYIYNILQQMAQVKLDNSIFSNSTFQKLNDNTVSFSPQLTGRNNPFSPVGTDSTIPGQSTSSRSF